MYQTHALPEVRAGAGPVACNSLSADVPMVDGLVAGRCHVLASVLREPVLRRTLGRIGESYTPALPASVRALGQRIDFTLLDPLASPDKIARLCREAAQRHVATVSVNSRFVSRAAELLENTGVGVCASVAFPFGAMSTEAKIGEARSAVWDGAMEIDMVLPIGLLKGRRYQEVFADIRYVRQAVERPVQLRVVLETGLLTTDEMIDSALIAVAAGTDAIKTSTGFLAPGPSPADVRLLRRVLGGEIGIKVAGNIHTWDGASYFFAAGASRVASDCGTEIARGFLESRGMTDAHSGWRRGRHVSTAKDGPRPYRDSALLHHASDSLQ
jgi:deoxyribose-phosphate aldolase